MKTLSKIALATAMTLSLAGTATALAQTSTTATSGHAAYVTLTIDAPDDVGEPATAEGTVPCQASIQDRIVRAWMDRPACKHAGYAYAYPEGKPAPWQGEIQWVNHTRHVDEAGLHRDTAEIVYRALTHDGIETVHATAGELRHLDRSIPDSGASYELPLPEAPDGPLGGWTVDVGPQPQPVADGEPLGEGT